MLRPVSTPLGAVLLLCALACRGSPGGPVTPRPGASVVAQVTVTAPAPHLGGLAMQLAATAQNARWEPVAVTVTRYAGLCSLATVQDEPLLQGVANFDCASPTVTVCSGREVATGGMLVPTATGEATSRSASAWTNVWKGTYAVAGGTITIPLERDGQRVTFIGTVSERRSTSPVTHTRGSTTSTLAYAFGRP